LHEALAPPVDLQVELGTAPDFDTQAAVVVVADVPPDGLGLFLRERDVAQTHDRVLLDTPTTSRIYR
jgi:hypothetical protein